MLLNHEIAKSNLHFIGTKDNKLYYGLKTFSDVILNKVKIKSIEISKKKVSIHEEGVNEEYFIVFSIEENHKYKKELNLFFSRILRGFKSPLTQDKLSTLLNLISLIQFKKISLIGLVGELLYIMHDEEQINSAIQSWHSGPDDLFDFTFDNYIAEIKSTTSATRKHKLNYRQFSALYNNNLLQSYYVSVIINNTHKKHTIKDLIQMIQQNISGPTTTVFMDKLDPYSDILNDEMRFDIYSSLKSIMKYDVRNLPRFVEPHASVETENLSFTVDFNKL